MNVMFRAIRINCGLGNDGSQSIETRVSEGLGSILKIRSNYIE